MRVTGRRILITFLLLAVCLCIPREVSAKNPVKFLESSVVINNLNDEEGAVFYNNGYMADNYANIVKWESTNEKVATASIDTFLMSINAVGVGECDVSAIDEYGNKATIHVTVKKGYIIDCLERDTGVNNAWYGTKKLEISSDLGTSGKVVIGKDTYKFSIKQSSEWPIETATVKLKKAYKLNTKATIYVTKKSNGVSCTYKTKVKLVPATWIQRASVKKKKLTLTIMNPHKGDVVKVTYKGKTVKKKITKNKDNKEYKVVLTMKKKLKKNSSLKIVIMNKDNKKLSSEKITLTDWKYEYEDPDEYTGSEDAEE